MAVLPSHGAGECVHQGHSEALEGVFEFAIIGPGVEISSHGLGLFDSVPATGPGCWSGRWSRQPLPGFPGSTLEQTQHENRGEATASVPPSAASVLI